MKHPTIVTGIHFRVVQFMLILNILLIALKRYRQPGKALQACYQVLQKGRQFLGNNPRRKYARAGSRYFLNYGIPAWPSRPFSRFIANHLAKAEDPQVNLLNTLLFGITKKCGFECEHCFEWFNLNRKEILQRDDLLEIINRFRKAGITQVNLSGGEPLNRFRDILFLLESGPKDIEYWIYTNGFSLTPEKASLLRKKGLRGVAISVDHHIPEKHDSFRGVKGSFERAMEAARYCDEAGLAVCFSLCVTRDIANIEALENYIIMARENGAEMIQLLEPKAVGHYLGRDVTLSLDHIKAVETFFLEKNFGSATGEHWPIITYHGFYSRRQGCIGGGRDYVYVDTDGYVHSCPFCQQQLYHALDHDLYQNLDMHRKLGCNAFPSRYQISNQLKSFVS